MERPKLADVARAAGVSNATVSLVMAGRPGTRVSPETARRVLEVAATLGYEPSPAGARSLRWISVVVDRDSAGDGAADALGGALEAASELGHAAAVIPVMPVAAGAGRALAAALAQTPGGRVAVVGGGASTLDATVLRRPRTVFVNCGPGPSGVIGGSGTLVQPDEAGAARRVGQVLAREGHAAVALVADDARSALAATWGRALRAVLPNASDVPVLAPPGPHSPGTATVGDLLQRHRPERATAFVCLDRARAQAVLREAAAQGLGVPRDVVVHARLDRSDEPFAAPVSPWHVPYRELGRTAVRLLVADQRRSSSATQSQRTIQVPFPLTDAEGVDDAPPGRSVTDP